MKRMHSCAHILHLNQEQYIFTFRMFEIPGVGKKLQEKVSGWLFCSGTPPPSVINVIKWAHQHTAKESNVIIA